MSTHNICFYGELEKIIPELSPNTSLNKSSVIPVQRQKKKKKKKKNDIKDRIWIQTRFCHAVAQILLSQKLWHPVRGLFYRG